MVASIEKNPSMPYLLNMPDATSTEVIFAPVETASSQETHYQVPPLEGVPIDFANAATWAFDHDSEIGSILLNINLRFGPTLKLIPVARAVANAYNGHEGYLSVAQRPFSTDARTTREQKEKPETWLNKQTVRRGLFVSRLTKLITSLRQLGDTSINEGIDKGRNAFLCDYCIAVAKDTISLACRELGKANWSRMAPDEIERQLSFILTPESNISREDKLIDETPIVIPINEFARGAKIIYTNAKKYCDPDSTGARRGSVKAVEFEISKTGITFRVRNTGEFISPEQARQIFDINRAMNADSQRPHFGLAALQRLLQTVDPEHKGAITLDSIPNPDSNDTARFLNTISFKIPVGK